MKEKVNRRSIDSPDWTSAVELARLAVAIAHWKGRNTPAFMEAEEIIESARRHLAGDRQIHSPEDYEREKGRLGLLTPQRPPQPLSKVDEIVQTLNDEKSHVKIAEPAKFPASRTSCLRLITGEKDPRRRARWLEKAGVPEKGSQISSAFHYRTLAAKIVPHLPRFGAVYPRRKVAAPPRDGFGKFTKAKSQRDARGRVKKIMHRDERGRIAKNSALL
jgi:hypothetical protein